MKSCTTMDRQGRGPVREFIDGLFDPKEIVRKRIFSYLMLLRDQGYLPFPIGKIVLLHGFVKKSGKTPPGEIEMARKRMEDHQSRFC